MLDIVKEIRERRQAKGMTQNDLAKALGFSRSYIGDLEAGRFNPTFHTIEPFLKVLGGEVILKWKSKT